MLIHSTSYNYILLQMYSFELTLFHRIIVSNTITIECCPKMILLFQNKKPIVLRSSDPFYKLKWTELKNRGIDIYFKPIFLPLVTLKWSLGIFDYFFKNYTYISTMAHNFENAWNIFTVYPLPFKIQVSESFD